MMKKIDELVRYKSVRRTYRGEQNSSVCDAIGQLREHGCDVKSVRILEDDAKEKRVYNGLEIPADEFLERYDEFRNAPTSQMYQIKAGYGDADLEIALRDTTDVLVLFTTDRTIELTDLMNG